MATSKPIAAEATISLPYSPEDLWPFVADTDRFDKAVGLPPVHFQRGEVGKDEPDIGEYRIKGVRVASWIEFPFEWERYRRFQSRRDYLSGPLRQFWGGAELTPTDAGTTIRVFAQFVPRNPLFVPFIRAALVPQSLKRSLQQYQAIGDFLAKRNATPFPQLVQQRTPANLERLNAGLAQLRSNGTGTEYVDLIRNLLADAPDEDVAGMRPLAIAEDRALDPQLTLEMFLRATVAGLLEMRWEMLCPGCRGSKADAAHLNELRAAGHCEACNLDFDADRDDLIEARFYPAPGVREVEVATFCVGSPVKTPHRVLQALLDPGETRSFEVTLDRGSYVLRTPQTRAMLQLRAAPDEGQPELEAAIEGAGMSPDSGEVRAGRPRLQVKNATDRRLTLTLDEAHTPAGAATPGRLMTLPAFQSLFSGEALAPGIELQISRVGLLFTDLAGSTALYQRVGDAKAFRLVTEHFGILRRGIEESGGALIKTVGDAVMAAFPDAPAALTAALRIQQYIREIDSRGVIHPPQWVKVGIHVGACFAVTQNDKLDYFGTAVNVAARAQHEAAGGEIVLTEDAYNDAASQLERGGYQQEWFTVQLKGITEPMRLVRVICGES